MLKVNKRSEPEEFTKYKKKNKVVNWKDFTSESEIKKLLKAFFKIALISSIFSPLFIYNS